MEHLAFQIIGYIVSAVAIGLMLTNRRKEKRAIRHQITPFMVILSVLALAWGIYIRIGYLMPQDIPYYLYEELNASLNYIANMLTGARTLTGATNMTFFIGNIAWQSIFGPSLLSVRALSAFVGLMGLIFLFFAVYRLVDLRSAVLTTVLATGSVYGAAFSRLAIETGWPLTFFALNLLCMAYLINGNRTAWLSFFLGLTVALGIFTYPGYTIWMVGTIPPLIWLIKIKFDRNHLRTFSSFFFGFSTVLIPTLAAHFSWQPDSRLFKGGGGELEFEGFWSNLILHVKDLFVVTRSYYLMEHCAFVEPALWGFFLLGTWTLVVQKRLAWAQVLLVSLVHLPIFSSLISGYPGMRRAIVFLYPFYIFSGCGMAKFLGMTEGSVSSWRRWSHHLVCVCALIVSAFSLVRGRQFGLKEGPLSAFVGIINHPVFENALETLPVTVALEQSDGAHPAFYEESLKSHVYLAQRFGGRKIVKFSVLTPVNGYFIPYFSIDPNERRLLITGSEKSISLFSEVYCTSDAKTLATSGGILFMTELLPCPPLDLRQPPEH